jgi:hypothetical protein
MLQLLLILSEFIKAALPVGKNYQSALLLVLTPLITWQPACEYLPMKFL